MFLTGHHAGRFSVVRRGLVAGWLAVWITCAWAHDPMSSWATLRVEPQSVTLEAELAVEAAMSLTGVPMGSAPGPVDTRTLLARIESEIKAGKFYRFASVQDGKAWVPVTIAVDQREEDGIGMIVTYPPTEVDGAVSVFAPYLDAMPAGQRSAFTILSADGQVQSSVVLRPGKVTTELSLSKVASSTTGSGSIERAGDQKAAKAGPSAGAGRSLFSTYFVVGVEHILTGYDHLLFLVGLLVVCRRIRSVLLVVTCFTVGHTVTLALAAVGWFASPSRIIEPLIAASIVFVGIENLLRRDEPKNRWLLSLIFGLVHGFGFAGALRDMGFGISGSSVAVPLFAFNLGVELGQLAVIAGLLPVLLLIRRQPTLARWDTKVISGGVAALGMIWLIQRL